MFNRVTFKNMFLIHLICFSFHIGEANDDQPFVPNNEKSSEYDPNLYLYSVSKFNVLFLIFRTVSYLFRTEAIKSKGKGGQL